MCHTEKKTHKSLKCKSKREIAFILSIFFLKFVKAEFSCLFMSSFNLSPFLIFLLTTATKIFGVLSLD